MAHRPNLIMPYKPSVHFITIPNCTRDQQSSLDKRHHAFESPAFEFEMTSKAYSQSGFPTRSTHSGNAADPSTKRDKFDDARIEHKREATIYDAVAGKAKLRRMS